MSIQEIANQLVELCAQGQFEAAQKGLYADDAISTEPSQAMGLQSVSGLQAIVDKGAGFRSMLEAVHSIKASDAIIAGNYFSVSLILDVTLKGLGKALVEEIAVYKVKDGKIVSEQFFY